MGEYPVGGCSNSSSLNETVWQVFGQEVRIIVCKMMTNGLTWQYMVNQNRRDGQYNMGQCNVLDQLPEYLDVRCPTADDDTIKLINAMVRNETEVVVVTTNSPFMLVSKSEECVN